MLWEPPVNLALIKFCHAARMRAVALLLVLTLLAACDSPGWEYRDAPSQTIVLEGLTYRVYARTVGARQIRAQVIRMEYLRRGQHGPVRANMVRAAEMATGCRANPGAEGDTGVLNLSLTCPR
jgi:hypothetical protein